MRSSITEDFESLEFGDGLYRMSEISTYTGVPYQTVYSWFNSRRIFDRRLRRVSGTSTATFHDLMDTMIAYRFRKYGVSMKEVRHAYRVLKVELQVRHPFCHRDIYTDGRKIIRNASAGIHVKALQEVVSKQQLFVEFKEQLDSLSFAPNTRLIDRWEIRSGVVLDPLISMGHPVVRGTGVATYIARNAYYANGEDAVFVAGMYGLTPKQVRDAVHFEDEINKAA